MKTFYYTDPDVVKYLVNTEDSLKYKRYSGDKILVKCPICGFITYRSVRALIHNPCYCYRCNDGISYPNKFILNFLLQLGINVETEKKFEWSMNKIYDDYIDDYKLIIENHGLQHYEEFKSKHFIPLEEQIKIDNFKKQNALNNGIKYYVTLDCRYSNLQWISQSIMNSDLPKILHFNSDDIDWCKCDIDSQRSVLLNACDLWENQHLSIVDIAKRLYICRLTVNKYLKKGASMGLCTYNPKNESQKVLLRGRIQESEEKKCKPVAVYNTFGITHIFKGATYLSNSSKDLFGFFISRPMIANVCNGKNEGCKGINIKRISQDEYDKYYIMFNGEINPDNHFVYSLKQNHIKQVVAYLNEEFIGAFISCEEASKILSEKYHKEIKKRGVVNTCLGIQKQHKGFTFKYITKEEYERYKMIENIEVVKEDDIYDILV